MCIPGRTYQACTPATSASRAQRRSELLVRFRDDGGVPLVHFLVGERARFARRGRRPRVAVNDVESERAMLGGDRRTAEHVEHLDRLAQFARRLADYTLDSARRDVVVDDERDVARRGGKARNRRKAGALTSDG